MKKQDKEAFVILEDGEPINHVQSYHDDGNSFHGNDNSNITNGQDISNNIQQYHSNIQGYPNNAQIYPTADQSYPSNGQAYPSNGQSYHSNGQSSPNKGQFVDPTIQCSNRMSVKALCPRNVDQSSGNTAATLRNPHTTISNQVPGRSGSSHLKHPRLAQMVRQRQIHRTSLDKRVL